MLIWMNVNRSPRGATQSPLGSAYRTPSLRQWMSGLRPGHPLLLKSIRFILPLFYHNAYTLVNRWGKAEGEREGERV